MGARSAIRRYVDGEEVHEIPGVQIGASSRGLKWQGLELELALSSRVFVDRLTAKGHYLSINLSGKDLFFQRMVNGQWEWGRVAPQGIWIVPHGQPLSVRQDGDYVHANCLVDVQFLDFVADRHVEVCKGGGVHDLVLANIFQALIEVLKEPRAYTGSLVDHLIRSFAMRLATGYGQMSTPACAGGIPPNRLKSLAAWLAQQLDCRPTVADMASQVGLSEAHFARQFKRSTGQTPWEYLANIRLEEARKRLIAGESAGSVAAVCGFSDQSHLCRSFRQKFGVSPSAYVRAHGEGLQA